MRGAPTHLDRNETVISILKQAKALIDSPERWCQKYSQIMTLNEPTRRCVSRAMGTAWEMLKAQHGLAVFATAVLELAKTMVIEGFKPSGKFGLLAKYNDSHDHATVMRAFDLTIERLQGTAD